MTLRLVHPPPGGPSPRPSKGRRSTALSPDETRHLRVTIKNVARAYGGLDVLASVLSVPVRSIRSAAYDKRRPLSASLALAVARAAGMSVEAIITGKLSAAGRCPTCHTTIGHRADLRGAS